ncbi:M14 family metallopeptidase [Oryzobacter faecalis]|uniref:M14 family metallopeptidase n=1 Tax=Oryzobacter faecalis TaxID=3388656 RepID=UPI00398D5E41
MKSLPVHARLPMTAALAAAVVLTGAGLSAATPTPTPQKVQLVHVNAPSPAERSKVNALGLDTTEHGDATGVEVVLHSAADAKKLEDAGFTWTVEDADMAATNRKARQADAAYSKSVAASALPSGRTSYRTLDEINAELDALAAAHPSLVKPITLTHKSVEGRSVRGIEITTNAANVDDGKPVMLMMGAHHAREWPSVEHAMEWAHELLEGYATDARTRNIVQRSRTIVVPVVNVDGFVISRSAVPIGDFSLFDYEMKRKNCTVSANTPAAYRAGTCSANPAGRLRGTDPNRNYPGFWGGNGASTSWSSDTYRGDGPGDIPEVDNIKRLISSRQVTGLITNHTYSNLVLRPPSLLSTGYAPDEPQYKALGARMTAANEYANWASFQLYDTSGSTEDWSYWQTGGYGFTFEIGTEGFHPEYQNAVVAEYLGLEPAAGAGKGGNREAYFQMAESVIDPAFHSTITGTAPAGRVLTVSKSFQTLTSPVNQPDGSVGEPVPYQNDLASSLRTTGGRFTWAVNPSTRPVVAGRWGRDPVAPAQPTQALANPAGTPATGGSEYATFTIGGLPQYDNFKAEVHVEWPDAAVDWDVYVYNSDGELVGSAASLADPEVAVLIEPVPGEYTVELNNYEGGETSDWTGEVRFGGPNPKVETGVKEAWTLTCSTTGGDVVSQRMVVVDRGQRVDVGNACKKAKD